MNGRSKVSPLFTADFTKKELNHSGQTFNGFVLFFVLFFSWVWLGTTFIVQENGLEVGRWEEPDGKDEIKIIEENPGPAGREKARTEERKEYYADGLLKKSTLFADGERVRETLYYKNRKMKTQVHFKNNVYDGKYVTYYENGQVHARRSYKEGKLNGMSESYEKTGKRTARAEFKDGKLHGSATTWDSFSKTENRGLYSDGKFVRCTKGQCGGMTPGLKWLILDKDPYYDY